MVRQLAATAALAAALAHTCLAFATLAASLRAALAHSTFGASL